MQEPLLYVKRGSPNAFKLYCYMPNKQIVNIMDIY